MGLEDWQKNEDGTVHVYPLVAYETLVAHGVMCSLRVHYLETPEQMLAGQTCAVPLILTPSMARQLATALLKSADEAENGAPDALAN